MSEPTEYRIVVQWEDDPDFSHLEQWTDPDDYAKSPMMRNRIITRRPELARYNAQPFTLSEALLRSSRYRVGTYYAVQFPDGATRLALPAEVEMTHAEYLETYGDVDNYVSVYAVLQRRCACCGEWTAVDSLGDIQFYERDDYPGPGFYSLDELHEGGEQYRYLVSALEVPADDTEPPA